MKLYLEDEIGRKIEIKEIEGVDENSDVLIFVTKVLYRQYDLDKISDTLTEKIGKKCVAVNPFDKILGV